MDMIQAIEFIGVKMEENAKAIAEQMKVDGLVPSYKAKAHSAIAGKLIAKVVEDGVAASAINMTILFHSLANHSAWRQKFEGKGIFPKAVTAEGEGKGKKTAADRLAALTAEFEEMA
jgi:hypothetical protein